MSFNNSVSNTYTDLGQLTISVLSETIGHPVSDARIQISDTHTLSVIGEMLTNSSGQTEPLALGAPPIEYSLNPYGEKPYSEYNLSITASGFEPLTIEGIQIFPNSAAIQTARLMPADKSQLLPQKIQIPPNTLWGNYPPKIIEAEVKQIPRSVGYVVLPEPIIPEFMVVHMGLPTNASAENIWVPFKDYIKNVASSELYCTWPEQSLRANILAIISFSLNRVYTEWYRGQGYGFTITNSTAYDQSFVYGRTIFEEIAVIVDEIFTTYITRPDIRQPLFTQYCDGVQTKCPTGMEQWGSKAMGDQGFDALSILRSYYGSNVYLTQAEKVQGVPVSYPGYTLQSGSDGANVRIIQQQLNEISNHYPAIVKEKVDGFYGDQTTEAVSTFQQVFHLPVTGVVDFATWYEISRIYVGVTRLAEPSGG